MHNEKAIPLAQRTACPVHPGEVLKQLQLVPRGITITELSKHVGVSRKCISSIVNGRSPITVDMAVRLAQALGTDAEIWINMQNKYDLWHSYHSEKSTHILPILSHA